MKKKITLSISTNKELKSMSEKEKISMFGPYEETLSLIRQFARVYQYEPALKGLGSYIVN